MTTQQTIKHRGGMIYAHPNGEVTAELNGQRKEASSVIGAKQMIARAVKNKQSLNHSTWFCK